MIKIEIKCRFSARVLFAHEAENNTMRITLEAAVLARAYLARAYLAGADLARANLAGADLAGADLAGADLAGADLDDKSKLVGERPIFQIGPIGSRFGYFVAHLTDKGLRLRAGCFFGTRDEFEDQLDQEHGINEHGKEYRAALAMIDTHAELWTPKEAEQKEAA